MGFLYYFTAGTLVVCTCLSFRSFLFTWQEDSFVWLFRTLNMILIHFWSIICSIYLCGRVGTTPTPGNAKKSLGSFWHITDIHVDREYSRTGNPNNLCHESAKKIYQDNGMYGNFLCDAPWSLVNLTIDSMKKLEPKPDFIIWTGDNLPHSRNPHPNWDETFKEIRKITGLLKEKFPGIPVYPSIGNHDTFPPNILQPHYADDTIYEGYLKNGMWGEILPNSTLSTFRQGGFYSIVVTTGLRMISLNTILWYQPNKLVANLTDPSQQFEWLEKELENASAAEELVYIIGHVPPGFYNRVYPGEFGYPTYHPQFLVRYMDIIKNYSLVIAGQYFAHIHNDMFQLYNYESDDDNVTSGLLASSVSPWYSNSPNNENVSIPVNPSIRLVQYSRANWMPMDYLQYYLNLSKANEQFTQEKNVNPEFELLYSFSDIYGVSNLSSKALAAVFEKLKSSPTLFTTFFKFLTAGKETVGCDNDCKSTQLCSMSCSSSETYLMCMEMGSASQNTTTNKPFPASDSGEALYLVVMGLLFGAFFILIAVYVHRYRLLKTVSREYVGLQDL